MPRFAVAKVIPFLKLTNFCTKKKGFFLKTAIRGPKIGKKLPFWQHFAIIGAIFLGLEPWF
jgi:hypothetical protein